MWDRVRTLQTKICGTSLLINADTLYRGGLQKIGGRSTILELRYNAANIAWNYRNSVKWDGEVPTTRAPLNIFKYRIRDKIKLDFERLSKENFRIAWGAIANPDNGKPDEALKSCL